MTEEVLTHAVTLIGGILAAWFGKTHINRIRHRNGHERRSVDTRAQVVACSFDAGKFGEHLRETSISYSETSAFQHQSIVALKEMCESSRQQAAAMTALGQLAVALARQAGIDTSLSPLDRSRS